MTTLTTGRATDFITFSRPGATGGGATVTDRDGKIKWAGHNLLTNSESFDASAWGKYQIVATANAIAAPNSTTTADTLTVSLGTGAVFQNTTVPIGTSTFSVFAKAGTVSALKLVIDDGASAGREATFTLSGSGTAGAVGNASGGAGTVSGGTSAITPLADSWYLCTLANVTTTATRNAAISIASNGTIYLWGAHLYRSDLGGMVLNPARGDAYYPTTPRNLLGFTEDFSNAAWTKTNILAFGSGSISNAIVAPNGLQTADKIVSSTANNNHRVQWSAVGLLVSGTKYVFSFYAKAAEYTKVQIADAVYSVYSARFDLTGSGSVVASSGCTAAITSVGDGWYRCSAIYTAGGANAWAHISPYPDSGATFTVDGASYTGDGISGIYVWGAQLSDSASLDAYSPVYGAAVTSAAYYAPRLDYSGSSLAALGLLVEEQRTNLAWHSADYTQSYWTKVNASIDATAVVAPDGVSCTTLRVKDDATNASHAIRRSFSTTNGLTYTLSFWVKKGTTDTFAAVVYADGVYFATLSVSSIDNNTQSVTGATGVNPTASRVSYPSGWYRYSFTFTATSASAPDINFHPRNLTGAYVGTGDYTDFYGIQLEQGSFATSYIPTGAATATRTADVASVSTQAFPYNQNTGSLVFSFGALNFSGSLAGASPYDTAIGVVTDGARQGRQFSAFNNTGWRIRTKTGTPNEGTAISGSGSLAPLNGPAVAHKLGIAISTSEFAGVVNGGTVTTDAITSAPTGEANLLYINNLINGYIRQITYIPRRLSNSELQARTV